MKQPRILKRHKVSSAHIDSTGAVGFVVGALACSIFIAAISWRVVNPWWLGTAMMAVALYEIVIIWAMNQFWDATRIFGVALVNLASLLLIIGLVPLFFQVELPHALPILGVWTQYGLEITLKNPGVVAVSYSTLAIISGSIGYVAFLLLEKASIMSKIKHTLRLGAVDLWVDVMLDRFAFWMDTASKPWFLVPLVLLIALCAVVVGSAALIA
jgi:hypothetical protein